METCLNISLPFPVLRSFSIFSEQIMLYYYRFLDASYSLKSEGKGLKHSNNHGNLYCMSD